MSEERDVLETTQQIFEFLQGTIPEDYKIPDAKIPKLTADQAWSVIWYLGNLYWQVPDTIERCNVCSELYDSQSEGDCLDYGDRPHFFCDSCVDSDEYDEKKAQRA